jgi:hypothetical protein
MLKAVWLSEFINQNILILLETTSRNLETNLMITGS